MGYVVAAPDFFRGQPWTLAKWVTAPFCSTGYMHPFDWQGIGACLPMLQLQIASSAASKPRNSKLLILSALASKRKHWHQ